MNCLSPSYIIEGLFFTYKLLHKISNKWLFLFLKTTTQNLKNVLQ